MIDLNQSEFVKDRLLLENVLLATELVKDYHKETISTRCAIKFDISKAFNTDDFKISFSSKKPWNQIRLCRSKIPWYRIMWFHKAILKYSFIVWLAVRNRSQPCSYPLVCACGVGGRLKAVCSVENRKRPMTICSSAVLSHSLYG